MKRYSAPWSPWLWGLSALTVAVCIAAGFLRIRYLQYFRVDSLNSWLTLLIFLMPVIALLFIIRGYTVKNGQLQIHRLLWNTVIPLESLQFAKYDPTIIGRSYRIFGNGGVFSFTGLYRNDTLGNYRAFATDLKRTVVLRFPKRMIVVSPSDPEDFVETITRTKENRSR